MINLKINVPSINERIIVPHKSFRVEGTFAGEVKEGYELLIELFSNLFNTSINSALYFLLTSIVSLASA